MNKETILAMEAGRELDELVATEVMGFIRSNEPNGLIDLKGWDMGKGHWSTHFEPSTNVNESWRVIEKLKSFEKEASRNRPIHVIEIGGYSSVNFVWRCRLKDLVNEISVDAPTAPEAICKASLLAVMNL